MKKKTIAAFIAVILTACSLFACVSNSNSISHDNGKLRIVTTIFPEYDWVMQILGDNPAEIEVTLLLENGVDLHSFQPAAKDILEISTCDLFIYVGGESDRWVEDTIKEAVNQDLLTISLLETLGSAAKEEEIVEGMQEEEEDADEHSDAEYDEHVWLSLRNAARLVSKIADVIQTIDAEHAELYRDNAKDYIQRLDALDQKYSSMIREAHHKTLLFGDRFPFRYLTDDYGLTYYAAFSGCSAETEASFETIAFLAQKADELSLPAILTIDGTDRRIAETIAGNTRQKSLNILTLDSMQSVTAKEIEDGTTYLSIMENNLYVLKEALQ